MSTGQASEMRFRPDLENPSKYSLTSHEKKVSERDNGQALDELSSHFPTFYEELERGVFKTSELVLPIQKLVYPNLLACGSSESPEDLKACVIDAVSPLLFGLRDRNLILVHFAENISSSVSCKCLRSSQQKMKNYSVFIMVCCTCN